MDSTCLWFVKCQYQSCTADSIYVWKKEPAIKLHLVWQEHSRIIMRFLCVQLFLYAFKWHCSFLQCHYNTTVHHYHAHPAKAFTKCTFSGCLCIVMQLTLSVLFNHVFIRCIYLNILTNQEVLLIIHNIQLQSEDYKCSWYTNKQM